MLLFSQRVSLVQLIDSLEFTCSLFARHVSWVHLPTKQPHPFLKFSFPCPYSFSSFCHGLQRWLHSCQYLRWYSLRCVYTRTFCLGSVTPRRLFFCCQVNLFGFRPSTWRRHSQSLQYNVSYHTIYSTTSVVHLLHQTNQRCLELE